MNILLVMWAVITVAAVVGTAVRAKPLCHLTGKNSIGILSAGVVYYRVINLQPALA